MNTVTNVTIIAKEWFDKVNGNSYFSAISTISFSDGTKQEVKTPFQYGYGEHYQYIAFNNIVKSGLLANVENNRTPWRYFEENNITYTFTKHEKCLKRDVISWGGR